MDARHKRLLKEISDCQRDTKAGISVSPVEEGDISHLRGTFIGPDGTPYAGGKFDVDIVAPSEYPFVPLKMRFVTKVYHPNISSANGAICLDILKDAWSPVLTVKTALVSLQSLLCSPEPSDPQDAEVARHYMNDRASFESTARYWTEVYAKGIGSTTKAAAQARAGASQTAAAAATAPIPDEVQLSGLSPAHVSQFQQMGFERARIIEVLRRLNYRGANVQRISDDDVVAALLG